MVAKIRITGADNKFHCAEFIDGAVTSLKMNASGKVTANGISEVDGNTKFVKGGGLQTPELVEEGVAE